MSKPRTLFITMDFPPQKGGEARFAAALLCGKPDSSLHVLAPRHAVLPGSPSQGGAGPVLHRLPLPALPSSLARPARLLACTAAATALAAKHRFSQIVSFQPLAAGVAGMVAAKASGARFFVFCHGGDILEYAGQPILKQLMHRILGSAAGILVNSQATLQILRDLYPGVTAPTCILHPPFDPALYAAPQPHQAYAASGVKTLLTVARLIPEKGHARVLQALVLLRSQGKAYLYFIVGEGPARRELELLVDTLGLRSQVTFFGALEDAQLPPLYAQADCVVLPSHAGTAGRWVEGFGMSALEAGYFGCPVIASRFGGLTDAILDEKTGLLIDTADPTLLAAAVEKVCTDPLLGQRLAKAAAERLLTDFTPEGAREKFDGFING